MTWLTDQSSTTISGATCRVLRAWWARAIRRGLAAEIAAVVEANRPSMVTFEVVVR